MARGGFPGFGGGNIQQMLQQAQKMQQVIGQLQEELREREYSAAAGGGMVTAKVSGRKEILELKIQPEAVDPEDLEMLEDMIKAAVNEAIRAADEEYEQAMEKATGGLPLGL